MKVGNATVPRLSVVIPTFNSHRYVGECVQSAVNQTERNIEVIVDDNTSVDGTVALLKSQFGNDSRVKLYENKEDLNIPKGWNRGLKRATGEYCLLLHSDNLLHPRYAEITLAALQEYVADVVYTECSYFEGATPTELFPAVPQAIPMAFLTPGNRAIAYVFQFQRMIPTSCLAVRRSCFESRMPFNTEYRWDPDIELMTWLAGHFSVLHLGVPLAAIRTHGGQAASWKDPTFSMQYRKLLTGVHKEGQTDTYHFLIHWAGANHDVCQKLAELKGVKPSLFFRYLRFWGAAETKMMAYAVIQYLRKMRLMGRYTKEYFKSLFRFHTLSRHG